MTYTGASLARILRLRRQRTVQRLNQRAERRRQLYRDDPIWRLTKLKDNRERKLRKALCE